MMHKWVSMASDTVTYINIYIYFFVFVQMYLVHFWAGLGLGWFWNADQSKEVWTWIKTLFVPDVNTKWILIDCRGPVCMYSNLLEDPWNLD